MDGEVALVTGGSSGIGHALANLLVQQGARVYLVARNQGRLAQSQAAIGGDVHAIAADLSQPAGAADAVAGLQRAGDDHVDLLVNCAGQMEVGSTEDLGAVVASTMVEINFLGAVRTIEAALPLLKRGRRRSIINVSSMAGRVAPPFMAAYAASKFALNGFTLSLRQELRHEGFHVGLVSPGPVMTPMIEGRVNTGHYQLPPGIPIVTPERVARAIMRQISRRRAECTVPAWLGPATRAAAAFPGSVDLLYRWVVPTRDGKQARHRPRAS
jgi:short-subunit dehydrogenase